MTIKQAIKELKSYADNSWGGLNEAFETAINALEKQIPKSPIIPINTRKPRLIDGRCPSCNGRQSFGTIDWKKTFNKYCIKCGQALDWSEKG